MANKTLKINVSVPETWTEDQASKFFEKSLRTHFERKAYNAKRAKDIADFRKAVESGSYKPSAK